MIVLEVSTLQIFRRRPKAIYSTGSTGRHDARFGWIFIMFGRVNLIGRATASNATAKSGPLPCEPPRFRHFRLTIKIIGQGECLQADIAPQAQRQQAYRLCADTR
jgi:hypothetical protein